jgi:positive regulator of sigma E activity
MKRQARVVSQQPGSVTLRLQRTGRCAGCPKNCNEPLFRLFNPQHNQFTLHANSRAYQLMNAAPLFEQNMTGQVVELSIEQRQFMLTSAVFFLLPLLLLVAGAAGGHQLAGWGGFNQDLGAGLGLLSGILGSHLLLRQNFLPKALKIMPKVTILTINGT